MESRDKDQDRMDHQERAARKLELQRRQDEENDFNVHDILRMDPRSLITSYDH